MAKVSVNGQALDGKFTGFANKIAGLTRTEKVGATAVYNAVQLGMEVDGKIPAELTAFLDVLPEKTVFSVEAHGQQSGRTFTVENLRKWLNLTSEIAPLVARIDEIADKSSGLITHESGGKVSETGESASLSDLADYITA